MTDSLERDYVGRIAKRIEKEFRNGFQGTSVLNVASPRKAEITLEGYTIDGSSFLITVREIEDEDLPSMEELEAAGEIYDRISTTKVDAE